MKGAIIRHKQKLLKQSILMTSNSFGRGNNHNSKKDSLLCIKCIQFRNHTNVTSGSRGVGDMGVRTP